MLIINISKIKKLPINYVSASLLDIPNTINSENKLSLSSFFSEDVLYPEALNQYKKFINEISEKTNAQQFKIGQLPIYWLSNTSNKHPIYYWGKDFFLLLTVLKKANTTIQKEHHKLVIILSKDLINFQASLKELLVNYGYKIDIDIIFKDGFIKEINFFQLLKTSLSVFKSILFYKKTDQNKISTNSSENYYLINSLKNQHTFNNQFLELKTIFNTKNKPLQIIPILEWRQQQKASKETPIEFINAKLTIIESSKILIQILKNFYNINKINFKPIKIDGVYFSTSFLKHDLISTLNNNCTLVFLNEWLQKFFTNQRGNYFYEDEFYSSGKTISFSIKNTNNKNIKSYGIQHGNFNEIHTVYTITEKEIKLGFPLPTHFIVWGNYYKQLMQQHNQLPNSFFLTLGNPKFVNYQKKNKNTSQKNTSNILWCLTTKECFIAEWEIIKNSDLLRNNHLTIRLHPLAHISKLDVKKTLNNVNFTISETKNLISDFNNSNFIITSAHSTIFLDAIVAQTPVIRLITNRWVGNNDIKSTNLFLARTSKEITEIINKINQSDSIKTNSELLELSNTKWLNYFNKA